MIRRLFTAASAISLLLFVAVVALWVRSRYVRDMLQDQVEDHFTFMGQSICESETLGLGVGMDTWNNVAYGKGWHWETVPASSVLTSGPTLKGEKLVSRVLVCRGSALYVGDPAVLVADASYWNPSRRLVRTPGPNATARAWLMFHLRLRLAGR